MNNDLYLEQIKLGPMENFVYLIGSKSTREVSVVDPAWDVPGIIAILDQHYLELTSILLTHGHFDHTEGLVALLAYKQVPTYISENELPKLIPTVAGMRLTQDNDVIQIGQTRVYVLHTPGHSPGGQCFYAAPHLIAGDPCFVFKRLGGLWKNIRKTNETKKDKETEESSASIRPPSTHRALTGDHSADQDANGHPF